jgi:nucleoside-diphosphate-sugar epimerase
MWTKIQRLQPVSLYAETKVAVETALLQSGRSDRWSPTPLRFATIYGVSPRMRFDLTVNEFTMELLTKKQLKVYGEQFWRPYVHARDAARAIDLVLNSRRRWLQAVCSMSAQLTRISKAAIGRNDSPLRAGCCNRVCLQGRRSSRLPGILHEN